MRNRNLVVIPTYNELENIQELLVRIFREIPDLDVLVVDDDSPDRTWEAVAAIAEENDRVDLLKRVGRRGLGTAYVEGFKLGLERGYELLLGMDADLSHDPDDIPGLIGESESYDVVLGSRYVGGIRVLNWPLSRLFLSVGANFYAKVITGLPMRDITGGFRCYRRRVLEAIDLDRIKSNGYCFLIEMSYKAWKKGFRLGEYPIVFCDRRVGQSKMAKRIIWESIWIVWKLRLLSLLGRL